VRQRRRRRRRRREYARVHVPPYHRRMHARNADDFFMPRHATNNAHMHLTYRSTLPYLPCPPTATLDILRTCALIARRNRLLRKLAISDIRLLRVPTVPPAYYSHRGRLYVFFGASAVYKLAGTVDFTFLSGLGRSLVSTHRIIRLGRRSMMRRLWAIADIHLSFKSNREEFAKLQPRGIDDGLILAGDGAYRSSRGVAPHRS